METYERAIRELIARVRRRWRTLSAFRAVIRAALASAGVVVVALLAGSAVTSWSDRAPVALAIAGTAAFGLTVAAVVWGLWPLRHVPSDGRVARFVEERVPGLDDRLATAMDVVNGTHAAPRVLVEPMLADAARTAGAIDLETVVPSETLRRAGFQAAAAVLLLGVVLFVGRDSARQMFDAAALVLFPEHVRLGVTPGDARVRAGTALAIEARLVGNRAPILPQVEIGDGDKWRRAEMQKDSGGAFRLALESITVPFKYRVVADRVASRTYSISVAHPPRIARIDVDYTYPAGLGLKPRTEEDSGDIYAPAGTDVRLRVHTDRPAASGEITLAGGRTLPLSADGAVLSAGLKIVEDGSYRIALADREGLSSAGDTEYFIRLLQDRPPEVHIVKPASDRGVTRLDEVDVEVQADDDYGIAKLDLVYSIRGGKEKSVPFDIPERSPSVSGKRTIYVEDLDVQPGDFIAYYARARDLTRGTRPNEARSDIFFLEVKPFEQEFAMAQSQSMAGSGYNGSIDDLVNAQKQVVVATWKLDRRAQSARGAQSEQDIRSIARTEAELKSRVEQTSSSFRESMMRDPRRPQRGRGGQTPPGQMTAEEDSMAAAADAMGRAVTSLDALKTADALPPEMEALNHLLKAQAEVKQRQVTRQQSGTGGPGNNNRNYDISTLFDKELQRSQQTNYETRNTAEQKADPASAALDKIRELAKRQDELVRKQQELTSRKLSEEELKRRLEELTREQLELRRQAEDLARQMAAQSRGESQKSKADSQSKGESQKSSSESQKSSSGEGQPEKGGGGSSDASSRMQGVSDDMRNAAGDLRRQDPGQASARASRALEKLRELEKQMQAARPDEKRRALGDMQLETRQLADAQRQVASALGKAGEDEAAKDTMRRLAGEQDRLAERAKRLQDGLKQQGGAGGDAGKEIERQRIAEQMQKASSDMRAAAQTGGTQQSSGNAAKSVSKAQQQTADALDKVADKLASATGSKDGEARKLSEQLARAQELRDRINSLGREMGQMGQQPGRQNGQASTQKTPGDTGRAGRGEAGGGAASGSDVARLREEYQRRLKEAQEMIGEMRRLDPEFAHGGPGFTFEGQGMTLSAPGTEAFKQDFAKWEDLRRQATGALDRAESSLSKRLQTQQSKDRLAAGVEDKAPPEYRKQADAYFKSLATKKKP